MKLVYRSITYEIQKQFPYQLQISRIVFAFESTFQTWLCECVWFWDFQPERCVLQTIQTTLVRGFFLSCSVLSFKRIARDSRL